MKPFFKARPQSGIERRQTLRVNSFYPIKILKQGGGEAGARVTNLRDVSEGGVQFWLEEELKAGSVHTCVLLIAQNGIQIRAEIEIMWSQYAPEQNVYYVGARFCSLPEPDRSHLRQWIEACTRNLASPPPS